MCTHSLPSLFGGEIPVEYLLTDNELEISKLQQKTCHGETIICPFCCKTSTQLNVNNLPNNGYVLHMLNMLKLEGKKLAPATPVATLQ
jgi:hypothetical protein